MTTTTAVQSPWAIVDQIIQQEIPDAVPGCEALRSLVPIADDKTAWSALQRLSEEMLCLELDVDNYHDETRARRLRRRVVDLMCHVGQWGANAVCVDVIVQQIRETLSQGAN